MARWFCLFVLAGLFLGCASVPIAPPALDATAKHFQPPSGLAQLYVVRDGFAGTALIFQTLVDGKLIGALATRTYLLLSLPPGKHVVSAFSRENQMNLPLTMEADRNYFVRLLPMPGWLTNRMGLAQLSETEGREAVLATSRVEAFRH